SVPASLSTWLPSSLTQSVQSLLASTTSSSSVPPPTQEQLQESGITPEFIDFIEHVSMHPTTWLNFPLEGEDEPLSSPVTSSSSSSSSPSIHIASPQFRLSP